MEAVATEVDEEVATILESDAATIASMEESIRTAMGDPAEARATWTTRCSSASTGALSSCRH